MRVNGPYQHRRKWRVVTVRDDGTRDVRSFDDKRTAEEAVETFQRLYCGKTPTTVEQALAKYETIYLRKRMKPQSVSCAMYRLDLFLGGLGERGTRDIGGMAGRYLSLQARLSVATHQLALSDAKRFGEWMVKQEMCSANPWSGIEPEGERKRGKPQLRHDEALKLLEHLRALPLGNIGATATMCALLLGVRASEIVERTVRDLDKGGTELVIEKTKTAAGERRLQVPDILRPRLLELCRDKLPSAPIINRSRQWVWTQVTKHCQAAGVKVIPPHGLRGTHGSLARAAGATPDLVARSLGHASSRVTMAAYVRPEAHEEACQGEAMAALLGNTMGNALDR